MEMKRQTKSCPLCGEDILAVAVKCKHCGSTLSEGSSTPSPVLPSSAVVAPPGEMQAPPPVRFVPGVLWFVVGSLPGFATQALFQIGANRTGMAGGLTTLAPSRFLDGMVKLTLAMAALLGLPAAAGCALVLRRTRTGRGWPIAVAVMGAFTLVFGIAFSFLIDSSLSSHGAGLRNSAPFFMIGALTAAGGVALANGKGRRL